MRIDKLIEQNLIGKTLLDLEFKINEDYKGARKCKVPQKIVGVEIDVLDGEDTVVFLELENEEEVYAYLNEDIIVE